MVDTDNSATRTEHSAGTADIVLRAAHDMVLELQPHRRGQLHLTTYTHLERDLGLDSLGRVELFHRLGRELDVDIPDGALTTVESLGDLVGVIDGVGVGHGRARLDTAGRDRGLERATALPLGADTLTEMLDWHVLTHPDRPHFCFIDENGVETTTTYAELREAARMISEGLARRDLAPGQTVAIMLPTCPEFFAVFFGILMSGGIPVPIYPPARLSQIEDHLRRQAAILQNAEVQVLITIEEAKHVAHFLRSQVKELRHVVTPEDVSALPEDSPRVVVHEDDIAFLQYTSGSTGDPKGVALSHANLLANIRAMGAALEAESTDVFVSWLPLYHDMGLIGGWLGSMYHAVKFVVMSPLTFLARPERWLWAIHRHGGTLSAAPNFAYDLCVKRVDAQDIEGLDLHSWRIAANGAEPVIAETIEGFCNRFKQYGFNSEGLKPVYGLAECSVGLAFPPLEGDATIDRIDRDQFTLYGQAVPAEETTNPLSFVACGRPLPRHEIRIVDDAGRELPQGREGRLQFRGPSATRGYYRNSEATEDLFDADWLESGDLAYTRQGDIFITGRRKDLIIKAGRNVYAQEIERAVGEVEGVRMGCVAVFGVLDAATGTEKLVVMAETRVKRADRLRDLRSEVESVTLDVVGSPADDVALVPPQTVLKTSSGKIRRAACRMAYESEGAAMTCHAVWWQFVRLTAASVLPEFWRILRGAIEVVYAGWWWLALGLAAVLVWLPVTLISSVGFCRALVRAGLKLFLGLTGIRVTVEGESNLPMGPKVLVSNHASYLDGPILLVALSGDYHFVAKKELRHSIWTGPFLAHLGTRFVERFDAQQGVGAVVELSDATADGETLIFFPEGTFRRMSGLLPFRSGAFACAAQGDVPVVPIAMTGTRYILRSESWFPRYGRVQIQIDKPIAPTGAGWTAVLALRDSTRERMLELSGEPDLVYETGILHTVKEEVEV
ncbi:MAG: acyl-phosphate glycerol 3-phosphate acyltransferase [Alphaproteobacteria bacterium]|nr:acyl-phosphate glycerol 3-phosphate acyltransferase [Alphaproteobacteria bacterium]|tara:strand:- start:267 stop:3131 length:2865 start_codon:yes stop_codon:yes gene_type:complete